MTKCKSCGKEHNLTLENMRTAECQPIEICKKCAFGKLSIPELSQQIVLYPDEELAYHTKKE